MLAPLALAGGALVPNQVVVFDAGARQFVTDAGDIARAGCTGGVESWPRWSTEVPYTPAVCQCGARAKVSDAGGRAGAQ